MPKKLAVEVWSDVACPWCYIGKRRLETALSRFPHADAVTVRFRSFELDPSAPAVRDATPFAERLAKKYETTTRQAEAMVARVVGVAAAEGLAFDFARIRPGNTFDAHRLLHAAEARGFGPAMKERFLRAYFCEGEPVGDHGALRRLAGEVGLGADDAEAVLASDAFASDVRADEDEARAIGVDGVPFFLIGRRYAVAGAQPAELLLEALERAWDELPATDETDTAGPACGPDGCA